MRFMEGMFLGGMLATGATMLYFNKNKMEPKKMMKKGKQFIRKMGLI